MLSIDLFEECTQKCSDNYLWKLGLGLVYTRLTNYNFQCSSPESLKIEDIATKCASLLFEVGEKGDDQLKGLAYALLVILRQNYRNNKYNYLFKGLNTRQILKKALIYGSENPIVLAHCGKNIKGCNVNKSIMFLKKSLEKRKNGTTLHHLGLSLEKKACMLAKKGKCQKKFAPALHKSIEKKIIPQETINHYQESSNNYQEQENNTCVQVTSVHQPKSQPASSTHFKCTPVKLKYYAKTDSKKLDETDKLVKEAIECYEEAIRVTREQNIPAILSLGNIYLNCEQYDKALTQYNRVIAHSNESYLLTLIDAYEFAGKCLQKLSENSTEKEKREKQANEHLTKAIGLAADLVSRNPDFENCETELWESLKIRREDIDKMDSSMEKHKEMFKLLQLVKKYADIVKMAERMTELEQVLSDIETFLTLLKSYLKMGNFEGALFCLNMASMKTSVTNNKLWSSQEIKEIKARTYIAAGWSRLVESSPDYRLAFQQMFQSKYEQSVAVEDGDNQKNLQTYRRDILVVSDETADSEDGPDVVTTLARHLVQIFDVVYGIDAFRNLMENGDYGQCVEETQLQEMKNYKLVLLILGENDSPQYDRMLTVVPLLQGPKVVVFNLRKRMETPHILRSNRFVEADDIIWRQTELLSSSLIHKDFQDSENMKLSVREVTDQVMGRNNEELIRLFCYLVEEDFEKHRKHLKSLQEKSKFQITSI